VVCGRHTGEERLEDAGIRAIPLDLSRSGFNPLAELRSMWQLWAIYRRERPDLVHQVTIKPVLYGGLIARMQRLPAVVSAISGLGHVFTTEGLLARVRRQLVQTLFRIALAHPGGRVIVQNPEDRLVVHEHLGVPWERIYLIRGSGVDLDAYEVTPEPPGPPVFALIARMLKDKGVREFISAANELKQAHPDWRFQLIGTPDPGNPSSMTVAELERWQQSGVIEWLGFQSDIPRRLQEAHVICLPSYYGEGLPKSLIEAAAAGRAMITTDMPGCREVVRHEVTGLLVPPRDAVALAKALARLGEDTLLRQHLGAAARRKAEMLFSVEDVVHDTFLIYEELLYS
jgi:glycosyltransferase involved in cell wall biosynthesis